MAEAQNSDAEFHVVRIRAAMAERGWSQRKLADKTLLGESTIFRLLRGHYSVKTLRKVERVLGLEATVGEPRSDVADIRYGGYVRELYAYYEGCYTCVRPAFADDGKIAAYPLSIAWSDEARALVFEDGNPGYEQQGVITVPTGTQFLHFVTLDQGSARLITAYHMPPNGHHLRGMVLTFANPRGRELYPAAAPIVMVRLGDKDDALAGLAGLYACDDQRFAKAVAHFGSVDPKTMWLPA